ncbi:MAG: hypothetical protein ACP5NW_04970 [Candidatus Woesearchaeota archaeon]
MSMMRGQIAGQIFLYILGVIVIGSVILFGFRLGGGMKEISEKYVSMEFRQSLNHDVDSLLNNYGSTYTAKYSLQDDFDKICFVDVARVSLTNLNEYPIIRNSVEEGVENNIFLYGEKSFGAFAIKNLGVSDYPYIYCTNSEKGLIEIKMISMGDFIAIKSGPYEDYCRNAQERDLCSGLDILFDTGYRIGCCNKYNLCC